MSAVIQKKGQGIYQQWGLTSLPSEWLWVKKWVAQVFKMCSLAYRKNKMREKAKTKHILKNNSFKLSLSVSPWWLLNNRSKRRKSQMKTTHSKWCTLQSLHWMLQSRTKVPGIVQEYSFFSVISLFRLKTVHHFRIFLQFSLPPPYTKLKVGKKSGCTRPKLFVGWGEGLDLCK